MEDKNQQFKWIDNIQSSINALVIAGGIEKYYEPLDRPCFGHEQIRKKSAFYKFSSKAMQSLKAFVPYCLHPVWEWNLNELGEPFGNPFYKNHIWLNRFYKPLGCAYGKFYDYPDYKDFHLSSYEIGILKNIFEFDNDHYEPIYYCHRKLETKKQVEDLIEKLLEVLGIFTTAKSDSDKFNLAIANSLKEQA